MVARRKVQDEEFVIKSLRGNGGAYFSQDEIEKLASLFDKTGRLEFPKDFPELKEEVQPKNVVRSMLANLRRRAEKGTAIYVDWHLLPKKALIYRPEKSA